MLKLFEYVMLLLEKVFFLYESFFNIVFVFVVRLKLYMYVLFVVCKDRLFGVIVEW